jgi:hypothetical protein
MDIQIETLVASFIFVALLKAIVEYVARFSDYYMSAFSPHIWLIMNFQYSTVRKPWLL